MCDWFAPHSYELMKQYTAGEYGGWRGNSTLHTWYEDMSAENREPRWKQYYA